jgi:hypothetical protein
MKPDPSDRPMGMRSVGVIWIGQVISILVSAITLWVYEGTEKATAN